MVKKVKNLGENSLSADILIVGGGMAGCSLACALAGAGFAVVVLDRVDQSQQTTDEFDGRASAIAEAPKKMLDQIGMWRNLSQNFTPILDIRVADGSSPLFLHYDHEDVGEDAFGYMVENRHFRRAVFARLKELNNVTYLAPGELKSISYNPEGVTAELSDGRHIKAGLLVGADGRQSQIRQDAGIKLTSWSYHQTGIVLSVDHEIPHHNIAQEHFLPAGPFAILPLPGEDGQNNRSSIVWTEKDALVESIMALPEKEFAVEFNQRFGDFLGEVKFIGPRWTYPLTLQYAETSIAERMVLVGDASHGMHPIAGQGLNMGLRDVAALAEVLTDARRLGLDIGTASVLDQYEQWRRFDNTLMLAMTDGLNRLFSNDIAPLKLARDIGLAAVNKAGPLKKIFMRHAMGSTGNLPRLLKGEAL
jgi:2-octaprenyl-6-methoxyphenol hydroxylase